jgi:flavin-dependent dehydrogenase
VSIAVAIAGAGPAGIATAVALVRRDPKLRDRIVVLDRARFPREKPCGGGLTGHAEEAMAVLGLAVSVPFSSAERAVVRCGRFTRNVLLPRPVRVVRRDEFDASLIAQARAMGIEVREATALESFRVERDKVRLELSSGMLDCGVLVGADGAGSLVRRHLRNGERTRPIRLFRLEIEGSSPFGDSMLYDFSPMSDGLRGYLWIFPVPGGRLNVGLMHDPRRTTERTALDGLLRRHLEKLGVELPRPARGWPAWGYEPDAEIAGERLLTVGDAAGIDALTGEGIAVGMEQALVASEEIARALASGDYRFVGYRRALRRANVGRELALDQVLSRMLYRDRHWRHWLSLVLFDEKMLNTYAARVSGTLVLAREKHHLGHAFVRHLWAASRRRVRLNSALSE